MVRTLKATARSSLAFAFVLVLIGCSDEPRPSVLLITVDTLRADRLSCYGYPLETTPNIDALAGRGVRFEDCTAQWPLTWPSMASFLSGTYPKTNGVRGTPRKLPESLVLLSELFERSDYRTAAVVSNFNLGKTFSFDRGFGHFVEAWQERWKEFAPGEEFQNWPGRVKQFTDATTVTDEGLHWLESLSSDEPFFLWLHYMDPHGPYAPPEEFSSLFEDHHPTQKVEMEKIPRYQRQKRGNQPIDDLAYYKTQYDREIRYLDTELGRLLGKVSELRADSPLLICFTADHGESLDEHESYLEHGRVTYQTDARVPAIIAFEGQVPAGRVVSEPMGLIDLSPTLLELVGRTPPASFESRSLAGVVRGAARRSEMPTFVFLEGGYDPQNPQRVVRFGSWKLIEVTSPKDLELMSGERYELYDLEKDPDELNNVAADHPQLVETLKGVLERWLDQTKPVAPGEKVDISSLDRKSIEMLKAFGYISDDD